MAKIEITVPKMGEGVFDVTVTKWLVKEGDKVSEDDPIVEIATDKVDSELPAPEEGIVEKVFFSEGDIAEVGRVLCILRTEAEDDQEAIELAEAPTLQSVGFETADGVRVKPAAAQVEVVEEGLGDTSSRTGSGKFLSPLVRSIAKQEGISLDELDKIDGTGANNRITKGDVLSYLESGKKAAPAAAPATACAPVVAPAPVAVAAPVVSAAPQAASAPKYNPYFGDYEVVEMGRMRKLIAGHMVASKQISPHVTSFVEADVTNLVNWRNKVKNEFEKREGQKITFTPIFIEAMAKAVKDFPDVNVSVDVDKIIKKKNISIGMATALPSGDLIVPVIKGVDEKSLLGITKSVNDLANRARANKLKSDEISGSTITMTNFGSFGNLTGTPVINQPEVAILGVGAIVKRPAVIETPDGDMIGIRHMMILSLSYDHRVVDGALGGKYLKRVAEYLENFDATRIV